MADLGGFDANQHEPNVGFEPVPAGKYLAAITHSEMKANRSGQGHHLSLQFTILEGEHKGRNVFANLNLHHSNTTAVRIAKGELSAICRATGVMTPKDSCELHDLPLMITVACKKRRDTGDIQNDITGYEPKGQSGPNAPAQAGATEAPWRR